MMHRPCKPSPAQHAYSSAIVEQVSLVLQEEYGQAPQVELLAPQDYSKRWLELDPETAALADLLNPNSTDNATYIKTAHTILLTQVDALQMLHVKATHEHVHAWLRNRRINSPWLSRGAERTPTGIAEGHIARSLEEGLCMLVAEQAARNKFPKSEHTPELNSLLEQYERWQTVHVGEVLGLTKFLLDRAEEAVRKSTESPLEQAAVLKERLAPLYTTAYLFGYRVIHGMWSRSEIRTATMYAEFPCRNLDGLSTAVKMYGG